MAITVPALREELNTAASDSKLTRLIASAKAQLDRYLADVPEDDEVPADVYDDAHLAVAIELFNIREAPNGYVNLDVGDDTGSTPIRIGSDPLRTARPLLTSWVDPVTFA